MTPVTSSRQTWAGLLAVVAASLIAFLSFVATPIKFLAEEVPLAHLLAVGRVTFRASLACEVTILIALIVLAAGKVRAIVGTAAAVLALQWFGLMPTLDARTAAVMAGEALAPSSLHGWWIAADAARILLYAAAARLAFVRS